MLQTFLIKLYEDEMSLIINIMLKKKYKLDF